MHSFLRSIGFAGLQKRQELDALLREVRQSYDDKIVVEAYASYTYVEFYRYFGSGYGIAVCGEYDEQNRFHREYYFPFFRGSSISTQESLAIEKHADKDSFAGICDDIRVGVPLIFYVQNAGEYLLQRSREYLPEMGTSLSFSGLAREGKILLSVEKDKELVRQDKENTENRNSMLIAARDGDEEAIENLTMDDLDQYTMISRRIQKEDVMSIVDTFVIPYGVECDHYNVLGEIVSCEPVRNQNSRELVWQMEVCCNDIHLDICINEADLFGEPAPGRRFKGIIWLQGYVNF